VPLIPSDESLPFDLKRIQFPIKPAFAISINLSQGQTLDYAGIWLKNSVFLHGQLYLALSRVSGFIPSSEVQENRDYGLTKNIVNRQVFSSNF
jgi:hypothetical protein